MSLVKVPEHVEEFMARTESFLARFGGKLFLEEELDTGLPRRMYKVEMPGWTANVVLHRLKRSLGQPVGEYRAQTITELTNDCWKEFRGEEGVINRMATLGAFIINERGVAVVSQCLIQPDNIETTAGTFGAAIVLGAASVVQGVTGGAIDSAGDVSCWTDDYFEKILHHYQGMGVDQLQPRGWSIQFKNTRALLSLTAVDDHSCGPGLRSLLRIPKEDLAIEGHPFSVNELNIIEFFDGEAPTFGGWHQDGADYVFASFAPNILGSWSHFAHHLITWGYVRAYTTKGILPIMLNAR